MLAGGLVACVAIAVAWLLAPTNRSAPSRDNRHPAASTGPAPALKAPPQTATTSGPVPVTSTTIAVTGSDGTFPAEVFYPASHSGFPYPLIVFSPGYDVDPGIYAPLIDTWAAARYVVAVPRYPGTAPGGPGELDEADIVNHPADLHAVIDRMLALSSAPNGPMAGVIDPARVGAAGQSDGGDVTDAVIANSCCRDPRIKAAASLSGAELSSFRGTYTTISVPTLVVQGDADTVNAPACSEQIYSRVAAARFYLDLHGASHLGPYTSAATSSGSTPAPEANNYLRAVETVSLLFWRAYLRDDAVARKQLAGWSMPAVPDVQLYAGGPVAVQGVCPGSPG